MWESEISPCDQAQAQRGDSSSSFVNIPLWLYSRLRWRMRARDTKNPVFGAARCYKSWEKKTSTTCPVPPSGFLKKLTNLRNRTNTHSNKRDQRRQNDTTVMAVGRRPATRGQRCDTNLSDTGIRGDNLADVELLATSVHWKLAPVLKPLLLPIFNLLMWWDSSSRRYRRGCCSI